MIQQGWIKPQPDSRALKLTPLGHAGLAATFDCDTPGAPSD
jgi:hypothetical protein